MSSAVLSRHSGLMYGLSAPAAGRPAKELARLTLSALADLKSGVLAGSSLVFNDLQMLAKECNTDTRDNPVFSIARRFLLAMPAYTPAPELSLDSDGEISFDWKGTEGRLLSVTLREDGRVSYASRISHFDKEHGTKQFTDSIPYRVLELVKQVTSPWVA